MSNNDNNGGWTQGQIFALALIVWLVIAIAAVLLWRYLGG